MQTLRKLLKFALAASLTATVAFYCFMGNAADARSAGAPVSRTGVAMLGSVPAEPNCTICHAGTANSGSGMLSLVSLPETYMPNQEIPITVRFTQSGVTKFGFQLQALTDSGQRAGELVLTEPARTQLLTGAGDYIGRQYITHTAAGNAANGTDQNTWTFTWRAPAQSVGRVTFYLAGNATNSSNTSGGDSIYTRSASINPASSGPQSVATVSAASFTPGALASQAIAALFAAGGLADSTVMASTVPLPTSLNGVQVKVRDAAGIERDAPLFFVSPGQINFLVPLGTANGAATLTVTRQGNPVGQGTINIEAVAPGFFSANANGLGLAAAVALRIRADGTRVFEPLVTGSPATAVPLDLGPESDQVFFIGFGTGWAGRNTGNTPTATIGGSSAEVVFAGAQGDLVGLDQANLRVPRSLAGRGLVNIAMTLDGKMTNTVQINIR